MFRNREEARVGGWRQGGEVRLGVEKGEHGKGGGEATPSDLKATLGTLALPLGPEASGGFWMQEGQGCSD